MADAQIHFTGNLGNAPELKFTQDGTAVCSASVAVNKSRKIASTGDPRQDYETLHTTWYRVSWWREIAEAVAQMNLEKGQSVTIDGEVFMEEYTTRDGQQGKALNVTATGVRAFQKRQQGGGFGGGAPQGQQGGYGGAPQGGYGQPAQGGGYGPPQSNAPTGGYDDPPF